MRATLSLFLALLCDLACGATIELVSRGDDNARYAIGMIELALAQLEEGPGYDIDVRQEALTALRLRQGLMDGSIDVIWTATSQEIEEESLAVRIPLYKGLLGNRIFIMQKDNVGLFAHVDTFDELKQFRFCQGRNWTDAQILAHNGLEVIGAMKYESLFYMTDGGRCDAFPRGVHEPWGELARHRDLQLTVDNHVMLVYRMPYYLIVSRHKPELADALERGLRRAINNGAFEKYFLADPMVKNVLTLANMNGRKVFHLENPSLPPATPLDDRTLWY